MNIFISKRFNIKDIYNPNILVTHKCTLVTCIKQARVYLGSVLTNPKIEAPEIQP